LYTVCPECLTRVSDKAKFCHHCGTRLVAEEVHTEDSSWACPACGPKQHLSSRRLGREKVSVAECQKCAGLWITKESFRELRDRVARDAAALSSIRNAPPKAASLGTKPQRATYRPCPRCQELMNRRQYARGSGVIIDVCRQHGLWFDAEELSAVLDWIARGGQSQGVADETPQKKPPVSEAAILLAAEEAAAPQDPLEAFLTEAVELLLPTSRLRTGPSVSGMIRRLFS
jgi:DNA-directed RNA polymerase subunit M/transcription elongation factor TFIIS